MEVRGNTNESVVTENRPVLPGDGGRQEGIREGVAKEHEEAFGVMVIFPV